jgi:hypothetical protein
MYASRLDTFHNKSINHCKSRENRSSYKVGWKIVVCHPGITEVAKSIESYAQKVQGVANPARTKETSSKRCQSLLYRSNQTQR